MPNYPLWPCKTPGCKAMVKGGYCDECRPKTDTARARKTKKVDPFYKATRWRKLRAWFLRRFPVCVKCGHRATHVDHIREWKKGGEPFDPDNLQSLCASCHGRKTRRERTHETRAS